MRMWRKILTSALMAAMLFTLLAGNVCAAEEYTYTVTLSAGNHGTFSDGSDKKILQGIAYNGTVTFNVQSEVKLAADSKYYVQGVRLSGRDNDEVPNTIFQITGDTDYVVAYGIKGNQVSYTVKYVDDKGKSLIPDDVFYGNVGDKPVVAYKYIEGYAPKALGLTKTLSENEAENVFTFVYVDAPSPNYKEVTVESESGTRVEVVEQYVVVPGGTAVTGGATGGASNVTGGGGAEAGTGEAGENAGGGDEVGTGEGEGGQDVIVDLDDDETPLANIDADGDSKMALPLAGYVAMGVIGLAALIAIIIMILKNKAKKEMNKE